MRLKKQSGYAVRIVLECAASGNRLTRIADISSRYKITKHNAAKTVPALVRNGILEAVRGRNGGIRLARPASEITIGEIVRATETPHVVADGLENDASGEAAGAPPPISRMLDDALEAFISVLDQHTVQDMLSGQKKFRTFDADAGADDNGEGDPAIDSMTLGNPGPR